jgi:hypothetical protein
MTPSLEKIVSACSEGVEDIELRFSCRNARVALRDLMAGLVCNTELRELHLSFGYEGYEQFNKEFNRELSDAFNKLLCDSSSLENVSNSNHTLEKIYCRTVPRRTVPRRTFLDSARFNECLELNMSKNKNKVIHNKVVKFYFVGDFDPASFASMPLPVLSEVLGLVAIRNKQSAIFQLLRDIPEVL